nr:MAG TPA_asm: hypothetical protein [Caudoviricetes sp.]
MVLTEQKICGIVRVGTNASEKWFLAERSCKLSRAGREYLLPFHPNHCNSPPCPGG